MKFYLIFLAFFIFGAYGLTIEPKGVPRPKPIKFLVLQRSDILEDDTATEAATDADDDVTTVEPGESEDEDENRDEVEKISKKAFIPSEAWKELNFPVVPSVANFSSDIKKILEPQKMEAFKKVETYSGDKRVPCQCGRPITRIVNGDPARINDIPWTAALVRNGFFGFGASKKPYCGGTLINANYVLTASHCVDHMFANGVKVWLNDEDYLITSETSGKQEYLVDEIIMHPDYNRRTVDNDIALLKLATPVPIGNSNSTLTPVCLPANNEHDFSGLVATVAGWGLTSDGGSLSSQLRKVDVPIMTNLKCNSGETKYEGKISDNMLCAGFDEGGKDSCQGDSGGPLIIDNADRKTLAGVVSWGFGCAQPKSPGVYTRVARYPEWIIENTKDATWCAS